MAEEMMGEERWLDQVLDRLDPEFLRRGARLLLQALMEMEVSGLAGAGRYERSESRSDYRNGYRERRWDTRLGTLVLRVPKLRHQGYQPTFLEPRARSERALFSVVQEAYVHGVSTRKVEELVQALGVSGMDKSRVSRMCAELDELVEEWRHRRLEKACPYVMLDGKSVRVREGGRVVNKAVLVAYGIQEDGYRSVLGLDVSCVESTATWRSFLRGLKERGLRGVKLVISDDHEGLKAAVAEVFTGSSWQRCVVHFMRNLEGHVAKKDRDALRAIIRSILKQESKERARERLREAAEALGRTKVAELLLEAEEDILAHMSFPASHWKQLRSTNPLERLNREIARRVRVVGIFPTDRSVLRLVGSLLMEQDEEWQLGRRYMSLESMAQVMASEPKGLLVGA